MNLDPRSVPVRALEHATRVLFFVAVGVLSGGGGRPPLTVVLGFAALGVLAVLGWELAYVRRFDYEAGPETFDIRSGVLSRRDREIPYERVQNVDISQNVTQRLFGLAAVNLETAGGSGTEASLRYVGESEARQIQDTVTDRKRAAGDDTPAAEPDTEVLFRLSSRELAVLGLVSADLRVLGLVSVVLSAVAPALVRQFQPGPNLVNIAGPWIALAGILVLLVISAVASVLRYYGFELRREGDALRYERGLLQRYSGTIPTAKIQTLTLRENALARSLGYAGLVIETAGYGPDRDGGPQSAVPIASRERSVALLTELESVGGLDVERPPRRARTRYAGRYSIGLAILVAALGVVDLVTGRIPWWPLVGGLVVFVPVAAQFTWVHRGYRAGAAHLVTRNGFWRRETVVVPYDRVQTVANERTPFQRRRHLGTLRADTASSGGLFGTEAVAADVDWDVAERLREEVFDRLQRTVVTRSHTTPGG